MERLLVLSDVRIAAETERARNAAADQRARARTLAWTVVVAAGWWLLGMIFLALSLGVRNPDHAAAFFWAALCVGNAGPVYTGLWLWKRLEG